MSRESSIPFRDEGSRRQWESSIGIVHSTPKDAVISSGSRVYVNPLKEQANRHRPVSPLLNLDEDRMNMDEYADVAGHFFTDVMTTSVPSRGGKRQKQLKEMRDAKNSSTVDKVYAQPSVLPKLRGCKQVRTKLQNETLPSKVESGKMLQLSKSKRSLCRADSITESVAFDRKFLFDDEISMCLSQFDHSAYAMIPGKLYKYEDTVASSKLKEEPVADLFVPYNVALMYLKVTVIEILFGKNFLENRQFQKALKKLRIWVFDKKKLKWTHLVTESDWTHAKLVAQEESERLRIMYSLRYIPGASGGSTVAGSSFCSTTVASQDITNASDDYSVLSDEFSGVQLDDEMRLTTASLSRLDCHTPNPPHVSVSGMLMLKNDEAFSTKSSFFEEIPKEQFMANYLESKLMKSRY